MLLRVTTVNYLDAYKLLVGFNNGVVREIDLSSELYGEMFEPLKDLSFFRQIAVNPDTNTIEWPNGADFAPEFLLQHQAELKKAA
jgi:Protein of unknown function (DUF2442)